MSLKWTLQPAACSDARKNVTYINKQNTHSLWHKYSLLVKNNTNIAGRLSHKQRKKCHSRSSELWDINSQSTNQRRAVPQGLTASSLDNAKEEVTIFICFINLFDLFLERVDPSNLLYIVCITEGLYASVVASVCRFASVSS